MVDLLRDVARVVPAILQMANFSQQLDRVLRPTSQVFDKADEKAILPGRVLNECGYFCLAQGDERVQSPFPAGQVVDFAIERLGAPRDGDWLFQADVGDVGNNALKDDLVAAPRVQDVDLFDRDHLHFWRVFVHAASGIFARLAMPKKKSSVLKR